MLISSISHGASGLIRCGQIRLNTTSKTERCQFENRGQSTEVIDSSSDQDHDFRDEMTWQAGTGQAGISSG